MKRHVIFVVLLAAGLMLSLSLGATAVPASDGSTQGPQEQQGSMSSGEPAGAGPSMTGPQGSINSPSTMGAPGSEAETTTMGSSQGAPPGGAGAPSGMEGQGEAQSGAPEGGGK